MCITIIVIIIIIMLTLMALPSNMLDPTLRCSIMKIPNLQNDKQETKTHKGTRQRKTNHKGHTTKQQKQT